MKTTAVIVDDEERARKALTSLVASELPQVELLGTADGLESGIQLVKARELVAFTSGYVSRNASLS